jgi:hypothetical protein
VFELSRDVQRRAFTLRCAFLAAYHSIILFSAGWSVARDPRVELAAAYRCLDFRVIDRISSCLRQTTDVPDVRNLRSALTRGPLC